MTAASQTLTVRVPLAIRRQGGRKIVITPEHHVIGAAPASRTRADPTLVKALARAHRWKRLLESGRFASEDHALLAPVHDWFTEGLDTNPVRDAQAVLESLREAVSDPC